MRARITVTLLAVPLCAAGLWGCGGDEQPREQDIALLFTQTAKGGSLERADGGSGFTLTLDRVAPQVVWFSDRPARQSGTIPIAGFAGTWPGFGFEDIHPNAALTLLGAEEDEDTVVLELENPEYEPSAQRIRYSARMVGEATGNLDHFEPIRDPSVAGRFGPVALFIDDAKARVVGGCPIQAYTQCPGADLDHVDLSGADLRYAKLEGADLTGTTIKGGKLAGIKLNRATLTRAKLIDSLIGNFAEFNGVTGVEVDFTLSVLTDASFGGVAELTRAKFVGADLTEADFPRAILNQARFGATLQGAEIENAKLLDTDFSFSDLTRASLFQSDITGAKFTGAIFAGTVCPNGRVGICGPD